MVLHQSVCCGLLCGALCAVHVPRPAVLLEKPVSVSFSLLLFDRQLWGSWISSALRYERDVECVLFRRPDGVYGVCERSGLIML